jgi:hypothetical protein
MKTGLLIQGPIRSPGFGPYQFNSSGKFEKSWIDFDCRENILGLVSSAVELFDEIVLSTWLDSDSADFFAQLQTMEKVTIIQSHQNAQLLNWHEQGIHKFHQIYTMRVGASKLKDFGCEEMVKVRTDQNLNLRLLRTSLEAHSKKSANSLGVPYLNLFEPDRLVDFYFVGKVDLICELSKEYLSSPEKYSDVHADYFYKFASVLSGQDLYRSRNLSSLNVHNQLWWIWTVLFYPLEKEIFESLTWRGIEVNHGINSWVRVFRLLHNSKKEVNAAHVLGNLALIFLFRNYRKLTLRLVSWLQFRKYRKLATDG